MDEEEYIILYTEYLARGLEPPVYIKEKISELTRTALKSAIREDEQAIEVRCLDPFLTDS